MGDTVNAGLELVDNLEGISPGHLRTMVEYILRPFARERCALVLANADMSHIATLHQLPKETFANYCSRLWRPGAQLEGHRVAHAALLQRAESGAMGDDDHDGTVLLLVVSVDRPVSTVLLHAPTLAPIMSMTYPIQEANPHHLFQILELSMLLDAEKEG